MRGLRVFNTTIPTSMVQTFCSHHWYRQAAPLKYWNSVTIDKNFSYRYTDIVHDDLYYDSNFDEEILFSPEYIVSAFIQGWVMMMNEGHLERYDTRGITRLSEKLFKLAATNTDLDSQFPWRRQHLQETWDTDLVITFDNSLHFSAPLHVRNMN